MSSYYCRGMKPKPDMFGSTYVASTYDSDYDDWQDRLDRYNSKWPEFVERLSVVGIREGTSFASYNSKWPEFVERFAEDFQFAILRAMAVVGVNTYKWNDVFSSAIRERGAFDGLSKLYLTGGLRADWRDFAGRIASEFSYTTHLPPYCPEWLLPYGYSQRQYLDDLAVFWDDIHDNYYKLWDTARFGKDSPEVARLKRLGEVARQEIDDVASHSGKYLGYD